MHPLLNDHCSIFRLCSVSPLSTLRWHSTLTTTWHCIDRSHHVMDKGGKEDAGAASATEKHRKWRHVEDRQMLIWNVRIDHWYIYIQTRVRDNNNVCKKHYVRHLYNHCSSITRKLRVCKVVNVRTIRTTQCIAVMLCIAFLILYYLRVCACVCMCVCINCVYLFIVFLWMCGCATIWWWNKDVYIT